MRVLVTGASGFVGGHLCHALVDAGHAVTAAVRRDDVHGLPDAATRVNVGEIGPDTDWSEALEGATGVIHVAGRAHVMAESSVEAEALYRCVNVDATARLAEQAAAAGVERFVFVSSIKACAENSVPGQPLTGESPTAPEDDYGRTKLDAERALWAVTENTPMRGVVVRPPLIYGPGIKGNLLTLFRVIDRGVPLPLGSVRNQRSLVYVGNLVAALILLLEAGTGDDGTFHIRDGDDVSTPELIGRIATVLGRPARLLPCPETLLFAAGRLSGRTPTIKRIAGTLQVDDRALRETIGWIPPYTMKEGLERTAAWYKSRDHE